MDRPWRRQESRLLGQRALTVFDEGPVRSVGPDSPVDWTFLFSDMATASIRPRSSTTPGFETRKAKGDDISLHLEALCTNSSQQAPRRLAPQTVETCNASLCPRELRGLARGGFSDDALQPRPLLRFGGQPPHELIGTSLAHQAAVRVMKTVDRKAPAPDRLRGRVARERPLGIAPGPGPYSFGARGSDTTSRRQLSKGALCRAVVEETLSPRPGIVGIDIRRLFARARDLLNQHENKVLRLPGV